MRLRQFHRGRPLGAVVLAAAVVMIGVAGVPSQGAEGSPESHPPPRGLSATWSAPNGDRANTRHVSGPIDAGSVSRLAPAWTVPIDAAPGQFPGTYTSTPVVSGGVVYTQDLSSNVYAIDLQSGRQLWTKKYNSQSNGPNGVNVGDGRVYGATATTAFALDAKTGQEIWNKSIVRNDDEGIDMAPGFNNGTVYVSTVPGTAGKFYAGNGQAILWAMDAATGAPKWKWAEVPATLWGNTAVNSGGGLWQPPGFDAQGNVYIGVGNPAPFLGTAQYPFGSSRPGPNLYTDSVVKLDGKTGSLVWYNQTVPHDIYDWDMHVGPVLTSVGGRQVVLGAGKMGYVFEFDQATGKTLWKTSVGKHNGHDNDNLLAMSGQLDKLPTLPFTIFPGLLDGVISQVAVDDTTVYAAVNDLGVTWTGQTPPPIFPPFLQGTGEMVAIDLATGAIKWQHKFDHSPYGAASVVNDLVFTTTFDGTVFALNTKTGQEVWRASLPAASNSPLAINGDTVIAAGGWPQDDTQHPEIVAYRLCPQPR